MLFSYQEIYTNRSCEINSSGATSCRRLEIWFHRKKTCFQRFMLLWHNISNEWNYLHHCSSPNSVHQYLLNYFKKSHQGENYTYQAIKKWNLERGPMEWSNVHHCWTRVCVKMISSLLTMVKNPAPVAIFQFIVWILPGCQCHRCARLEK